MTDVYRRRFTFTRADGRTVTFDADIKAVDETRWPDTINVNLILTDVVLVADPDDVLPQEVRDGLAG